MSSEQLDELIEDIQNIPVRSMGGPPVDLSGPLAQHLIELGYRRPRTITTVEELDALPDRTILLGDKCSYISISRHDGNNWWLRTGAISVLASDEIPLPATVLHEAVTA